MKTTSFTQAAIFVYFTGAHVSGIWVLGKRLTNQTKVSFVTSTQLCKRPFFPHSLSTAIIGENQHNFSKKGMLEHN